MNRANQINMESQRDLITIEYNELIPKTQISINGNPIKQSSELHKFTQERLNCWVDRVVVLLTDEINNDEFDIEFIGSKSYFYDVKEECERFSGVNVIYKELNETIQGESNQIINKSDKILKLKELVDFMEEGPIEELRDKKIREDYERAVNSEFEIAIIATMSAGKSTLINAMLGGDIMPSKNQACTAKICRIKNNKNKSDFSVTAFDKDGNEISKEDNVEKSYLSELNDNKNIFMTEVEGNICNIEDSSMNLVLIDTPGPNNSQDESHEETTMNMIKDNENKPLVLYVINATQIGTNDDKTLLRAIKEQMDAKDKQSRDRFIFVINKIDQVDSGNESIEDILNNTKNYLQSNGIENPNIYFASSSIAKTVRKKMNGQQLSDQEQISMMYSNILKSLNLLEYAPLSNSIKDEIRKEINLSIENENTDDELLYYTGIPYIEKA
ncbi:MAG: dynamin family protein, partial [Peptostreptococcaceae bacterium]